MPGFTFIHETGHTLGLKHAHEAMGSFGEMPSERDAIEYTVMSYRCLCRLTFDCAMASHAGWNYPQTLMMYDIAALQTMYGANYRHNNSDTVLSVELQILARCLVNGVGQGAPLANKVFMTLWDGGGTDTYDFSNLHDGFESEPAAG